MTADASVAGESFDLVVPTQAEPRVCVISMLHSSNIGQYGESKAADAERARSALNAVDEDMVLAVLADGHGFESNTAGLDGILRVADEFFQLATLWKVAVVAAYHTGVRLHVVLPDARNHFDFLDRYGDAVLIHAEADEEGLWVDAGEAFIRA